MRSNTTRLTPFSSSRSAMVLPIAFAPSTLPPFAFFASAPLTVGSTRRRRGDRAAGHVVHDLHVHVRDAAEHRQPRPRFAALHALADPVLDPVAAILFVLIRIFDSSSPNPGSGRRPGRGTSTCSGLPDLLLQHFTGVAHALLLVRIGLAHAADVRRHLADQLAIDAGHGDVRLLVDGDVDPARDVEHHRVRVAERELTCLPFSSAR